MENISNNEEHRLIKYLKALGWSDTEIVKLILFMTR